MTGRDWSLRLVFIAALIVVPFALLSSIGCQSDHGERADSGPAPTSVVGTPSGASRVERPRPGVNETTSQSGETPHDAPASRKSVRDEVPQSQFCNFATVPDVDLSQPPSNSRFASTPGYSPADDPEGEAALTGRRDAPWVDGDFEGAFDSFDDLVRAFAAAVESNDRQGLIDMRLSGYDFEKFLWPEMPQSRPVTKIPSSDAWFLLDRKGLGGISDGLERFGGRSWDPVRAYFREGRKDFKNFDLYSGLVVVAKETVTGEEVLLDFVTGVLERNGQWKVYTYHD